MVLGWWCATYACLFSPLSENYVTFTSYSMVAGFTQEAQDTYRSRVYPALLLNSFQIVFSLPQIQLERL